MKILTQLSGGIDSVAVLAELCSSHKYNSICPVFINYGQPYYTQELQAAMYAARHFQARDRRVFSLKEQELPLEVKSCTGVSEYIPYRNLVLTATCFNMAAAWGCGEIAVGSKSAEWRPDDPYSFKDSTAPFYHALEEAAAVATEPGQDPIKVVMPVCGWSKAQALLACMKSGMSIHKLWSCYRTGKTPCGGCYHCKEIEEAYHDPAVQEFMHREFAS